MDYVSQDIIWAIVDKGLFPPSMVKTGFLWIERNGNMKLVGAGKSDPDGWGSPVAMMRLLTWKTPLEAPVPIFVLCEERMRAKKLGGKMRMMGKKTFS